MSSTQVREALLQTYVQLLTAGLGTGSSGNVSSRHGDRMLITPTGVEPAKLDAGQMVEMDLTGEVMPGQLLPSSEWQMHAAIYQAREDVNAVVHCHSRHATILACAHKTIPPLHYMIAVADTSEIPLAPYATFGTEALADSAAEGMGTGLACLLANHGQITAGADLAQALKVAIEVEELAAIYWGSLAIGGGQLLSETELEDVRAAFSSYGQQREG